VGATSRKREALRQRPVEPLNARAARAAALDALARRDLPSGDLRRKLLEQGYDSGVVALLIEALRAEKLVDDERYAENFVAYHASRGQGPARVRLGLRQKGLVGELVEQCLAAYPDWMLQLREVQRKKFGAAQPSNYADKRRQASFLSYRGFTGAQIRSALGFDVEAG
jgi:regulatory protein